MLTALVLVAAYLLGSIPFGLVLTKLYGLGDVRQIGSGNIGATNVLRTGHKSLALLTLLLDGAKGAAAVGLAHGIMPDGNLFNSSFVPLESAAGFAAFLGHLYPVWLQFKGGKGVATALGIMLALSWPIALLCMLVWLMTALISRYSSLAALVAVTASPLLTLPFERFDLLPLTLGLAIFVIWKHKKNIERLIHKTEPRIGKKECNGKSAA